MAKKEQSTSGGRFFWGFVFGLAVGAALAVLFAPQPGAETREQLADQAESLKKRGYFDYEQVIHQVRERAADAMVLGKEAYLRAKDDVTNRYDQAKNGS
ncbi:MAG: YtxH domain-containing protein [Ktedonobacterales bacterium]